jgi:mRNA-degrading endonuclease RelE of RelBE toxin-antitoxin system
MSISSKGKGKSGGARVITYVLVENEIVYLVAIYDKSEHSTIDVGVLMKKLKAILP